MDTLVIVRKIREAETLADSGKHGEAKRLLEPLLADEGLTETHRKLVSKKLELFRKQQDRMTRIVSRRGTATSVRDEADQSSARTAIRKAVEDDRKSDRPTDLTIEKDINKGAATEVVPRAKNVDTEVPEQRGHKLKVEPRSNASSGTWKAVEQQEADKRRKTDSQRRAAMAEEPRREVPRPTDPPPKPQTPPQPTPPVSRNPRDSQELTPVADSDTDQMDALESATGDDPRKTDIFVPPAPPVTGAATQVVPVLPPARDEESAPAIGRFAVDKPVYPVGTDTPAPGGWRDTPVPQAAKSASSKIPAAPPPVSVRDSMVADTVMAPILPEKPDDDSTYLMAEDYFTSRASAKNRERSNPELTALADRLPDDDLRRELALEVVKLRQQLQDAEKDKQNSTRVGSRKIMREDKPESGSFHIPASQVNTIVRRAAGTGDIEVHMPGRDEEAQDLKVLRRDSVRGQKANSTPTDRIALAQDYIDAAQIQRPSILKPVATVLGVAVVLAIIGWAVHLGWQSITSGLVPPPEVSEEKVGDYELGKKRFDYPGISDQLGFSYEYKKDIYSVKDSDGWLVFYDSKEVIHAICATGPFDGAKVTFNGESVTLNDKPTPQSLEKNFGGANTKFSQAAWEAGPVYTMRFETRQGHRSLEFAFDTKEGALLWIRLADTQNEPKSPAPIDFKATD